MADRVMTRRVPRRLWLAASPTARGDAEEAAAELASLGYEAFVVGLGEACSAPGPVVAPPGWRPPPGCGALVVPGPPSPAALVDYARHAGLEGVWEGRPPWLDPAATARVITAVLGELRGRARGGPPGRPPPVLVASEVYADSGLYEPAGEARARARAGADYVVFGARGAAGARGALRLLSEWEGPAVPGFDYWDPALQAEAVEAGAGLVLSLTPDSLGELPARLRGRSWFALVPSDPRAPPGERVEELCRAAARAESMGYRRVVLDPVMAPPGLGAVDSLEAARLLSQRCPRRVPVMLGINNFYELLDADTTGSIAALASLAAEAGASLLLVGEESWKARGATLEARLAADMASLSLRWRAPPKDLGLRLLAAKWKGPGR